MSNPNDPKLFQQLEANQPEDIARLIQDKERLTPEEADGAVRAFSVSSKRHWYENVVPCVNWLRFILLAVVAVFLTAVTGLLVGVYLLSIKDKPDEIGLLLSRLGEWALVAIAALYFDEKRKN